MPLCEQWVESHCDLPIFALVLRLLQEVEVLLESVVPKQFI